MSNIGSSRDVPPASLSGLIATLAPIAVQAGIFFIIFLVLRRSQRRWYAPRTYLGNLRDDRRTPPLPDGLFSWFRSFWNTPDLYALQHQSLDAYLFLRFLRMAVVICFVGCCITWPILFPVNATGGGGQAQLDILSYSNIDKSTQYYRYFAHALVAWVYLGFIMYLITRECIFYINLRQAYLLSPLYSRRISTRTVLFTSVPTPYLDEAKLRKMFGDTVKHIWITGDTEVVDKLVEERDKVAMKLEKAEVKLIKEANKSRQNTLAKAPTAHDDKIQVSLDAESGSVAARWLPQKKRPTHKLGFLGLFGKKVDTINWCRTELERLIPAVETAQVAYRAGGTAKIPGVFIEFRTQCDAEAAYQVMAHHQALQMAPRYIGITPDEVVWKSLRISWWQRLVRGYAVNAFIAALIIFWAIPVAVVGIISNVQYLETQVFFLTWLQKIPPVIMGVITGLLPSVALAILMSLVPVIMRLCAKLAGEPSLSRVELFTQNAYFVFQVVQVFLVTTITSSASAVGAQIASDRTSVTSVLAENLPKASNFYISYFIVQGFGISANVLSQVVGFVIFKLLCKYLAGTPRALYTKWTNLSALSWGSLLPVYTNIVVISITYSTIAPLVLGFATIGMFLFYLAYRYNVLFVTDTKIDTRGLIYPRALKQLLTGIYLAEVCLVGLFAVSASPGPLVLMVAFLVFTVLFHISLNRSLDPLLSQLPLSLLAEEGQNLVGLDSNISTGQDKDFVDLPALLGGGRKVNFVTLFFKPWVYADYEACRALVPRRAISHDGGPMYTVEVEQNAYYPPNATSPTPLLWIPRDAAGISKQEIVHTSRVIPITDDGCDLDDKGNLQWDDEKARPPLWEEQVIY